MPVEIQEEDYTKEQVESNPDKIYVFGDNEIRVGRKGQAAACRGQKNVIGVRTKRAPGWKMEDYWRDSDSARTHPMIDEDFARIEEHLKKKRTVVFPINGLGTGLAFLPVYAPRTLEYINEKIRKLKIKYK